MSAPLAKAAISHAEQGKGGLPSLVRHEPGKGGLQVRWTFCKSALSLQFLSHDMAKKQLPSISSEQGAAYAVSPVLQTAYASYSVTRCTPAIWGIHFFLVYSPLFKSVQHNHLGVFWPCDLPWHIYDHKTRERYKSWQRAPERMCAPPMRKDCVQNWKKWLWSYLLQEDKFLSKCLHLPEEVLGMSFTRSSCSSHCIFKIFLAN